MNRWTARFAVLVMLVPVVGPLALAQFGPAEGMHCMRRPVVVGAGRPSPASAMPCHHGETQSVEQSSQPTGGSPSGSSAFPETSFRSLDCCRNHDCCRGATTSEWARPASRHSSCVCLLIEPALRAMGTARILSPLVGADS